VNRVRPALEVSQCIGHRENALTTVVFLDEINCPVSAGAVSVTTHVRYAKGRSELQPDVGENPL
jgi:hypothetical protein